MQTGTPQTIYLKDYAPPDWLIDDVFLDVSLAPEATRVAARLSLKPNPERSQASGTLELHGEKIALLEVSIDVRKLNPASYAVSEEKLTISGVPDRPFMLDLATRCAPASNTELSGLYMSNGIYCTQCEAEGFRRIIYFLDRPDVMARYRVRIEAAKST